VKQLYVETSSLLAWLFDEPSAAQVGTILNQAGFHVASSLTILEASRNIIRGQATGLMKAAEADRLRGILARFAVGCQLREITPGIRTRAAQPFPVEPVRSLDAIHLATALEFSRLYPEMRVLSRDRRVVENLDPLGLQSA